MKILFIASKYNPFNPTQGATQRSSLLLQACCAVADVDVISFCTTEEPSTDRYNIVYQSEIETRISPNRFSKFKTLVTPRNPEAVFGLDKTKKNIIDSYVKKKHYDYIVVRYMPEAIQCGLLQYAERLVIDLDDHPVDRVLNEKQFVRTWKNKIYYHLLAYSVKVCVKYVLKKIRSATFTNKEQVLTKNSYFLPNVPYYEIESYDSVGQVVSNRLLFVGDLSYPPNIQGINHFIKNVYPKVLEHNPNVTIHIVGKIFDQSLIDSLNAVQGVTVMGFVPSLKEEYEKSSIVVIPIYLGAGTCIKVLEAMQMQRVCVTTPVGFRGYNEIFTPSEDVLLANNDDEFAAHILNALIDEEFRKVIIKNANKKQKDFYSRENFFHIVRLLLETNLK